MIDAKLDLTAVKARESSIPLPEELVTALVLSSMFSLEYIRALSWTTTDC